MFNGLCFVTFFLMTEAKTHGCHILQLKAKTDTAMHSNGQGFPGLYSSDYSIDSIPKVRHCRLSSPTWWTNPRLLATKATFPASHRILKLIIAVTKQARKTPYKRCSRITINIFLRSESQSLSFHLHFSSRSPPVCKTFKVDR